MNQQMKEYSYTEYPLERNDIRLYLSRTTVMGEEPGKQILLVHGVTYSSHQFDIPYRDYSLVRRFARAGYAVWCLDIAGFGRSGEVQDGFLPDSDYAAEDIHAAVQTIIRESGQDRIDLLGWSWGTVTCGRFAAKHPEYLRRLVLYAPILSGVGAADITEPFHHNTWEHAAEDFRCDGSGNIDLNMVDPVIVDMQCSRCWHYDREYSPNAGRRDICVPVSEKLILLDQIRVPTLIICGDRDSYMNYDLVYTATEHLPEDSVLEIISGASHAVLFEEPYYRDFQERLVRFLEGVRHG